VLGASAVTQGSLQSHTVPSAPAAHTGVDACPLCRSPLRRRQQHPWGWVGSPAGRPHWLELLERLPLLGWWGRDPPAPRVMAQQVLGAWVVWERWVGWEAPPSSPPPPGPCFSFCFQETALHPNTSILVH